MTNSTTCLLFKFMLTVSHNGNPVIKNNHNRDKIHKKLGPNFNVTERERFATFAVSNVSAVYMKKKPKCARTVAAINNQRAIRYEMS